MPYGSLKADNLIHSDGSNPDVTVAISSIAAKASTTGAVFTGNIDLDNQKELRLREADAGGDNFVALRAPSALAGDITLTFPAALPAASTTGVLQSTDAGALTWAALGLDVASTWTAPQRGEVTAVTHNSNTISLDFTASNNFFIQLVSGQPDVTTIQKVANSTDSAAGQSGSIFIQQPTSGTPVNVSGWTNDFRFPAQTALAAVTATLGVVDRIDYIVKDADEIHVVSSLNMSST